MPTGPAPSTSAVASSSDLSGYWRVGSDGTVHAFGDAHHLGNAPIGQAVAVDLEPTSWGQGYRVIFAFGDAAFAGSMGGKPLNAPVQSLVPDGDGAGYWLVASDGGVLAFDAPFRGSMGGQPLNRPVTGMVPFGSGYLMVGEDGGIFNFSDRPFHGSLGAAPPAHPIVAVAVLDE